MSNHFVRNLFFLLCLNIIIKPLWIFGFDLRIQNLVGETAYGTYFAVSNFTMIFYVLLDFGIANFNSRALSHQPELIEQYWWSLLGLKIILGGAYGLVCLVGAWWLGYDAFQYRLLLMLAFNQVLISFITYFRSNLQGLHFFTKDSWVSVLDRVVMMVLCGALLLGVGGYWAKGQSFSVEWFVYIQTFAYLFTAAVCFVLVWRQTLRPSYKWNSELISNLFRQSAPFALIGLLMSIYSRLDGVMLEYLLPDGAQQAGIYATSYRLLDACNMFGVLISTQLLPQFARYCGNGDSHGFENAAANNTALYKMVSFAARWLLTGAILIVMACWLYRQAVMEWLYSNATPFYGQVFGWLMLSFLPIASVYVFGTLLTAKGSVRRINYIVGGGMLLSIVANGWLIPSYKALGAAWASLLSQSSIALAFVLSSLPLLIGNEADAANRRRWLYIKAGIRMLLFIATSGLLLFLCKKLPFPWQLNLVLGVAGGLLSAFAYKILRLNDYKTFSVSQ